MFVCITKYVREREKVCVCACAHTSVFTRRDDVCTNVFTGNDLSEW